MGGLLWGSVVWLVLTLVIGAKIISHVGQASPLGRASDNKK